MAGFRDLAEKPIVLNDETIRAMDMGATAKTAIAATNPAGVPQTQMPVGAPVTSLATPPVGATPMPSAPLSNPLSPDQSLSVMAGNTMPDANGNQSMTQQTYQGFMSAFNRPRFGISSLASAGSATGGRGVI